MVKKKISYRCDACGETVYIIDGEMEMPECCETPMKTVESIDVDFCKKAVGPEFSRLEDDDLPCDDGRSGRI
jgi:hypothetical protein